MKHNLFTYVMLAAGVSTFVACSNDNDDPDYSVKPYTVPTTYDFNNASYTVSSQRVKMAIELDGYLKLANAGTATVPLDQAKVTNMFNNTGNPFADASLNTSAKISAK